jgi:hypothetical protein
MWPLCVQLESDVQGRVQAAEQRTEDVMGEMESIREACAQVGP